MTSFVTTSSQFIKYCRYTKSLSLHTVRAYAQDLRDFSSFIGSRRSLESITSDDVETYVQNLLGRRSLSPATAKRRLGCLRVYFRWLQSTEKLPTDPLEHIKMPIRLPRRLPRVITRNELRDLVRSTAPTTASALTSSATHLAILMMASTGIRVAELVSMLIADVDTDEGRIRIHGKGNRERTVFVTDAALQRTLKAHIRTRLKTASQQCRVFVNERGIPLTTAAFRRQLRSAADAAAIPRRVTPHMLRHTAATLLLEEGVDIRFVQRLLGHQSIATTELYTHITDVTLRTALTRANLIKRVVTMG